MEVERSKLMASLQECQTELTRENRHLASIGSERLIKEHRVSTVSYLSCMQGLFQRELLSCHFYSFEEK